MITIKELYDLRHTLAAEYLGGFTYPWEALQGIKQLILTLGPALGEDYTERSAGVWVHKTAKSILFSGRKKHRADRSTRCFGFLFTCPWQLSYAP